MSMTFVRNRQRRHGEPRNQNDRGGDARKLSLQAHAVWLSQVPSGAKQFSLIARPSNPAIFGREKDSVHKVPPSPRYPQARGGVVWNLSSNTDIQAGIRGESGRARISLSRDPPSGDIRDSNHCEGAGSSGPVEALLVVSALRRRACHSRERSRRSAYRPTRSSLSSAPFLSQSSGPPPPDVSSGGAPVDLFRSRAALASHKRVHARLGGAMASGQRGYSFEVRSPDTRPETGSLARASHSASNCAARRTH